MSGSLEFETLLEKTKSSQEKQMQDLPKRSRFASEPLDQRRATLLLGPRGVGKTTALLSAIKGRKDSLYLSLDSTVLASVVLYEFGDWLFSIGYQVLIFDEVHMAMNWSQHLKSLYDSNPGKKIIASDSSSLVLKKGTGDLSRRFVNRTLPFLSFREFLWLKLGVDLPRIDWARFVSLGFESDLSEILDLLRKHKISVLKEFREYLNVGYRPFFLEGDYQQRSSQIIDKIVFQDIPYFLPELNERHIHLMRNILSFLAESKIPRLVIEPLATKWQVSKSTVYNLIEVMKETSLIRIIPKEGSIKARTRGEKMFFSDPTHYGVLQGDLGNLREAYFCAEMARLKKACFTSEDENLGDFKAAGLMFEVGGEGKKAKGSDYVLRDNTDSSVNPKVRPLWALGFCE